MIQFDEHVFFRWVETTNYPWTPQNHGKNQGFNPSKYGLFSHQKIHGVGSHGRLRIPINLKGQLGVKLTVWYLLSFLGIVGD